MAGIYQTMKQPELRPLQLLPVFPLTCNGPPKEDAAAVSFMSKMTEFFLALK